VRARVGGASTTSFLLAAHFAKRNTKFGGGGKIGIGKRWRAKIPSPQPPARLATRSVAGRPSFLPARAFSFCRAKRGNQSEFRSKKVRASFSNCDQKRRRVCRVGGAPCAFTLRNVGAARTERREALFIRLRRKPRV